MADKRRCLPGTDDEGVALRARSHRYRLLFRLAMALAAPCGLIGTIGLLGLPTGAELVVFAVLCVASLALFVLASCLGSRLDKAEARLRDRASLAPSRPTDRAYGASLLRPVDVDDHVLPHAPGFLLKADDVERASRVTASDLRALLAERFGSGATYERYAAGVARAEAAVAAELDDVRRLADSFGQDALGRAVSDARAGATAASDDAIDVAARSVLDALDRADATTQAMQRLYVSLLTSDNPTDDVAGELDALSDGLDAYR